MKIGFNTQNHALRAKNSQNKALNLKNNAAQTSTAAAFTDKKDDSNINNTNKKRAIQAVLTAAALSAMAGIAAGSNNKTLTPSEQNISTVSTETPAAESEEHIINSTPTQSTVETPPAPSVTPEARYTLPETMPTASGTPKAEPSLPKIATDFKPALETAEDLEEEIKQLHEELNSIMIHLDILNKSEQIDSSLDELYEKKEKLKNEFEEALDRPYPSVDEYKATRHDFQFKLKMVEYQINIKEQAKEIPATIKMLEILKDTKIQTITDISHQLYMMQNSNED